MYAGSVAAQLGQVEEAVEYWRRATKVNPWSVRAHDEVAGLLLLRHDWKSARDEATEVLRLDPFQAMARRKLIIACLRAGEKEKAHREFDQLLRLHPAEETALRAWFRQAQAARTE